MSQPKWQLVVLSVLVVATSSMADAQVLATSFDQLRLALRLGDTVKVTEASGQQVTGTLADLSTSSLTLLVHNNRLDLAEREIATIRRSRHASLGTGAKWGFGVGAGLGTLTGLAWASEWRCGALVPITAAFYGGVGSGIGVGVSALITSERVIYSNRGTAAVNLAVSPVLTRERKGIVATIHF